MSRKSISAHTRTTDVPYDPQDGDAVEAFWDGAIAHQGLEELRAKRGRPPKPPQERKEQISLRIDADVLDWYRTQGEGWQTKMNAVLKAYRDASS